MLFAYFICLLNGNLTNTSLNSGRRKEEEGLYSSQRQPWN